MRSHTPSPRFCWLWVDKQGGGAFGYPATCCEKRATIWAAGGCDAKVETGGKIAMVADDILGPGGQYLRHQNPSTFQELEGWVPWNHG